MYSATLALFALLGATLMVWAQNPMLPIPDPAVHLTVGHDAVVEAQSKAPQDQWSMNDKTREQTFAFTSTYSVEAFSVLLYDPPPKGGKHEVPPAGSLTTVVTVCPGWTGRGEDC